MANPLDDRADLIMREITKLEKTEADTDVFLSENYGNLVDKLCFIALKLQRNHIPLVDIDKKLSWLPSGDFDHGGIVLDLQTAIEKWSAPVIAGAIGSALDQILKDLKTRTKLARAKLALVKRLNSKQREELLSGGNPTS